MANEAVLLVWRGGLAADRELMPHRVEKKFDSRIGAATYVMEMLTNESERRTARMIIGGAEFGLVDIERIYDAQKK
jgi:hypothetical protein